MVGLKLGWESSSPALSLAYCIPQAGHVTLSGPQSPHLSHLQVHMYTRLSWVVTLREAEPGERAWLECPHLLSAFNQLPTSLSLVLSASPAKTSLQFLCPLHIPHHPRTSAHGISWECRNPGPRTGRLRVSILGRILVLPHGGLSMELG